MLIHGWATDANYWNAQLQPLQARYTVVTLDLAGHGASTHNRSDWSMPAYGEDVAVVAGQLTNRQIVLVGHAMGATVALEACSRIGARVIGIIGVDAWKSIGLPPLPAADINARVAPFRADFIGRTRSYVTESLFPKDANPTFSQKVAYDMSLEPAEVAIPSLQALLAVDLNPLLRATHVPLLAINSDMETTDVARIRRLVPDFHVDVIPHSSHFLMMDDAARFNPLLLKDIALLQQRAGSQR
ncbi:MAG: alpha/beta hydrolase [Sinobacteraceae bacterium]|nr:alpha/beta hydrolase [Nevskiaceae bacterium]